MKYECEGGGRVDAGGFNIYAATSARAGAGRLPPLVFVHGLGVSGRYMLPALLRLARVRRVYAPDLPGSGRSDKPARALDDPMADKLPRVRVPALVLRWSRDPVVTARWAREVPRLVPLGELVTVEGAAHALNYNSPSRFARAVRLFLGESRQAVTRPAVARPGQVTAGREER